MMPKESLRKGEQVASKDAKERVPTNWITLEVVVGDITKVEADAVVCSSNGFLLMGSGSAGALREAGGYYRPTPETIARIQAHTTHLPLRLADDQAGFTRLERQSVHTAKDREGRLYFSQVQTEAFDLVARNGIDEKTGLYTPYQVGDVIHQPVDLNADADTGLPHSLYHVIAMTYELAVVKHKDVVYYVLGNRVPATADTIRTCMHALLDQLQTTADATVAIPLIGSNKGGLTAVESAQAITKGLLSGSKEKKLHVKLVIDSETAQKSPRLSTVLESIVSPSSNRVEKLIHAIKAKLSN